MAKKSEIEKAILEYPRHAMKPLEVATFIQLETFSEDWDDQGLTDDDLRELEVTIMAMPKAAPVVKGTGGLRKLRFSPTRWPKGKSGALRVGYVCFPEFAIVVLILVYPKTERGDISAAGRKIIRSLIDRIGQEFSQGHFK